MLRRHFLQGLGAAIASLFAWGRGTAPGVEPEREMITGINATAWTPAAHGTLFGFPIIENPDLNLGIEGPIELVPFPWVSDELLEDGATDLEQWVKNNTPLMWDWSGPVVYGAPKLTTRIHYRIDYHTIGDREEPLIWARYKVAGTDRVLRVESWMSLEMTEDSTLIEWMLGSLDEEAEYCAAHPDEIPVSHLEWT